MKTFKRLERVILFALTFMMAFVLLLATVDLGRKIVMEIMDSPFYLVDVDGLLAMFGAFLIVLIGIELLETVKAYFRDDIVHVEVVLLIAIIAIARKVIVLEYDKYEPLTIAGIGVLIAALAVGYFFIKKAGMSVYKTKEKKGPHSPLGK